MKNTNRFSRGVQVFLTRMRDPGLLLEKLHVDRGRILRRMMYLLTGGLIIVILGFKDIGDIFLRISVNQGEPTALNLYHDLVPLAETMMAPVQIDFVLIHLPRHYRLGLFKTLSETSTHRFAADQKLKASHARILFYLFGIHIDQANDPIAVGSARSREEVRRQRTGYGHVLLQGRRLIS